MSKIYLAARYSRNAEMRNVRDVLTAFGHEVTSRWIDQHGGQLAESYTPDVLNADPERCGILGQHDVEDLLAADTVISFTSDGGGGKGGRHVEHGLALGAGKRVIVVGPRENIFHTLPQVEHHPDWTDLLTALLREAGPMTVQLAATDDGELVGVTLPNINSASKRDVPGGAA